MLLIANLTAALTIKVAQQPVDSLRDVKERGYRICAARSRIKVVAEAHNVPENLFAVDPVEEGTS